MSDRGDLPGSDDLPSTAAPGGSLTIWRVLMLAQVREQPVRLMVVILAIALGVALGAAVYQVNSAALNEFGLATKRLVGEADVVVRGPEEGFSEQLFVELVRDRSVASASPVLEVDAAIAGRHDTLKVLGVDALRAAALQPAVIGDIGGGLFQLFEPDSIYLSSAAAEALQLRRGDQLRVVVGAEEKPLHVLGILSPGTYTQALGVMDIASAQWIFNAVGRLNRIDLRLPPGADVETFRAVLESRLPPGVHAIAPQVERDRAVTVTRAYRVNLNMLALVALFTGAFLVFSTQSLSVMRRSPSLALLRALGVTQGQLRTALLGEGIALGMAGALLGIALGNLVAVAVLHYLTGDLGNGQLHTASPSLSAAPAAMLAFFVLGAAVAGLGAWIPARSTAKLSPAKTLKGGGGEYGAVTRRTWRGGMLLLGAGSLLAFLPAIRGLPIFGYAAVATLLFGAVLLVPALTVRILQWVPRGATMIPNLAVAQLRENVSVSTLNLASIIVSFSLMVAMAIMVYSFRQSFDQWLDRLLPADLQLREPFGNDTAYWSESDQAKLAAVPGVARAEFRRTRALLLDPARPPVTLIARGSNAAQVRSDLPLMQTAAGPPPTAAGLAWISESLRDVYGYQVGDRILLPLGSRMRAFEIAGIWRDYARVSGAVVITRPDYTAATADTSANEGSIWLQPGADSAAAAALLRERVAGGGSIEIITTTALHERSLQIFDRAFAITYALEAIAVIIGLMGVSFGASSTALSRRAEFGMLRHIGLLRRQVMAMLASEGVLMSVFGAAYGLALGGALSLVLIYVINRQSFHWSIDLSIPLRQLLILSATLVGAAALTAVWGGRAAMSQDAVRAVREDW